MTQLRAMEVTGANAPDRTAELSVSIGDGPWWARFEAHYEPSYYERPLELEDEPTQVDRLAHPKFSLLTPEERVEQLCKSVAAVHFHLHVCQQIENHIGSGDPLDVLLKDIHHRAKFKLEPRKL